MPRQEKSRGWCFTINNPTIGDQFDIESIKNRSTYVIFGTEFGSENNTPHYQGFAIFPNALTLSGVRSLYQRAHWERQRGTTKQAIDYCKKEGLFEEHGTAPSTSGTKQKEIWRAVIDAAERGDMQWIKDNEPGYYLRYFERLRSLRSGIRGADAILQGSRLEHEWWYGPTGTGKSRTLWSMYPNHYQKELNKWWDGYEEQDVVAIEEWCPKNECTASFLKIWADRYPFTGQIKGGTLQRIRPKKIIVLSNYTIEQCFTAPEDYQPIKRRFRVKHFPMVPTSFQTAFQDVFEREPESVFDRHNEIEEFIESIRQE